MRKEGEPGKYIFHKYVVFIDCVHISVSVGRHSFLVAASIVWNSFPVHVQSSPSISTFRQRRKTFLFQQSFPNNII